MQFGVFTIGDITTDPVSQHTPLRARAHRQHRRDRAQG